MGNNTISLALLGRFTAVDSQTLTAIRDILSDVKACAASNWEGCNWEDEHIPVSQYENIYISRGGENGGVWLHINLPDEWKLGREFSVRNHSAGLKGFSWDLHPSVLDFDTITIDDVCFGGFTKKGAATSTTIEPNMTVNVYTNHSPLSSTYPGKVSGKLDMSGSGIRSLLEYYAIPEIILDDCLQLEEITLIPDVGQTINALSARNCPALRSLELNGDINITSAQIEDMINTVANAGKALSMDLRLEAPHSLGALTIGKGVSSFYIKNIGSLIFSNASDLVYAGTGGNVSSISVSNCAQLETLKAAGVGLESFSISSVPVIKILTVNGNPKLTMQVPAVFDQIRNSGGHLEYYIRYDYRVWGANPPSSSSFVDDQGNYWYLLKTNDSYFFYHDRGYGFYYSDEPGRGYHLKD